MAPVTILWADDEIDLLKPQLLFLESKGYQMTAVTNGNDALSEINENDFDLVFLDEQMPGISGLETLSKIKEIHPSLPVVMVTKSEEENVMDDAIGNKIADYLIKPVNPTQMFLTIKKILDNDRLRTEKSSNNYQQAFRNISMQLMDKLSFSEWQDVYKKLVYWELELEKSEDTMVQEILNNQKEEANKEFSKFIKNNYEELLEETTKDEDIVMSHNLFEKKVFPKVSKKKPTFVFLIDNLRYDHWKTLLPLVNKHLKLEDESLFSSILPTTTHYSRNAIFSGLLPNDISKKHPEYWRNDEDEGGKNQFEEELLKLQLKRHFDQNISVTYNKIYNQDFGKKVLSRVNNLMHNDLNVIIFNFVDMLSHARTEDELIKELANDEAAYRSVIQSWFEHSTLIDFIKEIAKHDINVIFTTDHGTIRVSNDSKVIGSKDTTTNLRYKHGRNMEFNPKDVYALDNPNTIGLPAPHINSKFIFALEDKFFVYPNNYNHFANYYRNTFQHGGISIEEMMIPVARFTNK